MLTYYTSSVARLERQRGGEVEEYLANFRI